MLKIATMEKYREIAIEYDRFVIENNPMTEGMEPPSQQELDMQTDNFLLSKGIPREDLAEARHAVKRYVLSLMEPFISKARHPEDDDEG